MAKKKEIVEVKEVSLDEWKEDIKAIKKLLSSMNKNLEKIFQKMNGGF